MKRTVSFRFSEESIAILGGLSRRFGLNRTAVLEYLVRRFAEDDAPGSRKGAPCPSPKKADRRSS